MSKHARLHLNADYHDGVVEAVEVGPRREVVITIRLDPVWNDGNGSTRRLHLSAIQNFEEVAAFFRRASPAKGGSGFIDEVIGIVLVSKGVIGIDVIFLEY